MEPLAGLEPATPRLQGGRSQPDELKRQCCPPRLRTWILPGQNRVGLPFPLPGTGIQEGIRTLSITPPQGEWSASCLPGHELPSKDSNLNYLVQGQVSCH